MSAELKQSSCACTCKALLLKIIVDRPSDWYLRREKLVKSKIRLLEHCQLNGTIGQQISVMVRNQSPMNRLMATMCIEKIFYKPEVINVC